MLNTVLAVVLALASAVSFAVASVVQQRVAVRSSNVHSPEFVNDLTRSGAWWLGLFSNGSAFVLQIAALGFGPLVLVQPVLVSALVFALPVSAHLAGRRLTRTEWGWTLLLVAGLAVFVALVRPGRGVERASSEEWTIVGVVVAVIVAGCVIVGIRRAGFVRALAAAGATGLLAGVLAVLTKSTVATATAGDVPLYRVGELYAAILVGLGSLYLRQVAYQAGALKVSLPTMTVLEPIVAVALGLTLLHEQLSVSAGDLTVAVASAAAIALATAALARDEAAITTDAPYPD